MKINDKGGEIGQRYENFGKDWDKEVEVGHGHGQRGSNIEECEGIKILGQEKHISRGSKLMNLIVCIWYVHIHVLACIAQVLNLICMLVWCMLDYRKWLMKWKLACIGW
jgi:hypothetical protein